MCASACVCVFVCEGVSERMCACVYVCIGVNVIHFNFVVLTKQRPRIWNDHFLLQRNDIMSIQYMYFSMKTCGCNREKQSYEELPVVFKSSLQSASFRRFKYYRRQSWREKNPGTINSFANSLKRTFNVHKFALVFKEEK